MSDEIEKPEEADAQEELGSEPEIDHMSPQVRACFERGNEIREAKREIGSLIDAYTKELIECFPGHEDAIRRGLEGAAANLLALRDKRKRDERKQKRNSDGQSSNPGANGVSTKLREVLPANPGGGEPNTEGSE